MAENDQELKNSVLQLLAEVERLKAEKAALQSELQKQKQALNRQAFPGRRTLTWILILLACSTAVLAPVAVWARRSFLDTNNFANLVAPLAADDTVAKSLSSEVAHRLFVQLEMQKQVKEALQEALPDKLAFLAGPLANSLETLTQKVTYEIITSPQFQAAWDKILRLAHSTAVGVIRGDRLLAVSRSGEVVLDVGELLRTVRNRLVATDLRFLEKLPISAGAGEIVLFTSSQLGLIKTSLDILDTLNWLLPFLCLVFFAAALVISEDRRSTLMWLSVALAVAMVFSLLLLNLAGGELVQAVKNPNNLGAAMVIWNKVTAGLVQANMAGLMVGIVGTIAFALAGPYPWALRIRQRVGHLLPRGI